MMISESNMNAKPKLISIKLYFVIYKFTNWIWAISNKQTYDTYLKKADPLVGVIWGMIGTSILFAINAGQRHPRPR